MKKLALCLVALGLLAACETMEGFGRDVSHAGDAITGEAEEAQQ